MKYFLHDTNAFQDEKITELYIKFGYEGLGLFYTILEKLALQEKPIKTVVLKSQLKVGKRLNKCWNFMEEIGIISTNNGETFNKQLLNFSEKYKIKKEKNAKRISEWRKKQENIENVTCNEQVSNTPKVKRSKVKRSNNINIPFENFWNLYSFKKDISDCRAIWEGRKNTKRGYKITEEIREAVMTHLPEYVENTNKDGTYPSRKYPKSYLNGEGWKEEIIKTAKSKKDETEEWLTEIRNS